MNNTQENFLTHLVELYKNGTISQKNFMKQINQTEKKPTVKQVKNLQKTVSAKSTRGYNKARKVAANASQNIHKNVAEGNLVIEKLNMHFDIQAINKMQSNIKAQSKKTFDKADKLIGKLDKIYPNEQILELPRINMTLSKEKAKLAIEGSIVIYWEEKHAKSDKYPVNVSLQYRIWNESETRYEEGTVGPFQYDMPKNLS